MGSITKSQTKSQRIVLPSEPSSLDAPARLIDLSTGLPSITTLYSDFRPLAEGPGSTILYLHLPSTELIEDRFGWEALEAYTGAVTTYLTRVWRDLRQEREICVVARAFADDYVLMMPTRKGDGELVTRISDGMMRHLGAIDDDLAELHRLCVGRASTGPFMRVHPERRVYRAIQQAQQEATNVGQQRLSEQARVLDRCIRDTLFRLVFQPIVDVRSYDILSYEALVRCDEEELKNPHVLFNIAEKSGRIWPLSRLLRQMAAETVPRIARDRLMFINVHPDDFNDPRLLEPEPFMVEHASQIVVEVTERATIKDFEAFRSQVEVLRSAGIRIAVDDLGGGFWALNSVAELDPDFIKFDMTLIRNIHESPVRQNLMRNM
ncbi:MAG: EAL domain-containing protein, partial [Deltaproteobacteria bacterium]|nr:EAL domain-containing protein [Deltaproteobacteria bacterium]